MSIYIVYLIYMVYSYVYLFNTFSRIRILYLYICYSFRIFLIVQLSVTVEFDRHIYATPNLKFEKYRRPR